MFSNQNLINDSSNDDQCALYFGQSMSRNIVVVSLMSRNESTVMTFRKQVDIKFGAVSCTKSDVVHYPVHTRRRRNVVLMLVRRPRQWPNIKTTLGQRLAVLGVGVHGDTGST